MVTLDQIPLDDIDEGIRLALWSALATPLGLKTCEQTLYAFEADEDQLCDLLPLVRIYPGTCIGDADDNEWAWKGSATWTIVFEMQFPPAMAGRDRCRALTQAAQQIAQVFTTLSGMTWALSGYTAPANVFIRKARATGILRSSNAELESSEVNIGVANVPVKVDLVVSLPPG